MTAAGAHSTGGYAAGVLREMYGGSLPRAASQLLRDHAKARSSSAPAPHAKPWTTGLSERPTAKRSAVVQVPRVGQGAAAAGPTAPRPPRIPARKSLAQILDETSNYDRTDKPDILPLGRDNDEMKWQLQNKLAFNFGTALPHLGGPSHLPGEATSKPSQPTMRRVTFASLPPSRDGPPTKSGLTPEQERLASNLVTGVQERQQELDRVEESLAKCVSRVEVAGLGTEQRRIVRAEMASHSQKRLELKSAIRKDVLDLEKLMDLAPSS